MEKLETFDPVTTALAIIIITSLLIGVYATIGKSKNSNPAVKEIHIYPIKSCGEIQVDSAAVSPRGFRYDRCFQVVYKENNRVWKFCTPRNSAFGKLFHIQPTFSDGSKRLKLSSLHTPTSFTLDLEGAPTTSIVALAMGDKEVSVQDFGDDVSKWLSRATGIDNPRLVGIGKHIDGFRRDVEVNPDQGDPLPTTESPIPVSLADEAPFLLTTQESFVALNKRLGSGGKDVVDMRRFRPNIVIEGLQPWEEDSLKRLKIGEVEFHVWQRCGRCTMTTIDRDTLARSGEPLRTLGSFRERENGQRNFGMHMIPVCKNEDDERNISVGDKVEILEYDDERRAEWMRLFGNQ